MQTTVEQQTPGVSSEAPAETRPQSGAGRYLTFSLQGEIYALDIAQITEIIEFRTLTVVPMMPAYIRGIINLRGRVLPVVDLAARFERGATTIARRTSVIVVEAADGGGHDGGEMAVGIIVDAVNKVVHLGEDDIKPAPAFGAGIRCDFISGMAKYEGEFIVVLDISRVLSAEELSTYVPGPGGGLEGAAAPAGDEPSPADE